MLHNYIYNLKDHSFQLSHFEGKLEEDEKRFTLGTRYVTFLYNDKEYTHKKAFDKFISLMEKHDCDVDREEIMKFSEYVYSCDLD